MQVQFKNNINFEAKFQLNNKSLLKNTPIANQISPVDCMFNENKLVHKLNDFAIFIKKEILCKHLNKPKGYVQNLLNKMLYNTSLAGRYLADRIFFIENYSKIKQINKIFDKIQPESNEYIEEYAKLGASVKDKFIIINTEDKVLDEITNSNTSTLFILNHPNYNKDKFVYSMINSIINQLYVTKNKQATCPRPKIIVSKNILKIVHPKVLNIYKKLGIVPIDASLEKRDSKYNAKVMLPLFSQFLRNKVNIFLFPEGNNSSYIEKPIEERIQKGVVSLIEKTINIKKQIRIVPIGINYNNEKNSLGQIYIGKPVFFDKNNNTRIFENICKNIKDVIQKAQSMQNNSVPN